MAKETAIAWCDSTWSPWMGCTKVSPGCDHCYASVSTPARTMKIAWGPGQPRRRTSEANWRKPLQWNREPFYECQPCGWRGVSYARADEILSCPRCRASKPLRPVRRRVFCSSLADVFDNEVPAAWRVDLLRLIESTPYLTWLVLTKRIGNVDRLLDEAATLMSEVLVWPLPNVWLGATIVNQEEADRDIPKLLETQAAKRFVSYEPALGPVDWAAWLAANDLHKIDGGPRIDWIIVGGESDQPGMRARPFDLEWARSTIGQCRAAGVACFVKQLGSSPGVRGSNFGPVVVGVGNMALCRDRAGADPAEWPEDLRVRSFPK